MQIFDSFITELATFLEANVTTLNANASFNAYANVTEGLASYIGSTYSNITNVDQYHGLGRPFREQYIAKFGKAPYWNPQTRGRWSRAATLPPSSYTTAIERTRVFQAWFRNTITPSCESTLVLYPMGAGTDDYRDIYTTPPGGVFASGLPGTQMSVLAALPDYTVPIGERTYLSRVTERNETLPITIGTVAAAGCDYMLMDLIADLADAGVIAGEVKTRSNMY